MTPHAAIECRAPQDGKDGSMSPPLIDCSATKPQGQQQQLYLRLDSGALRLGSRRVQFPAFQINCDSFENAV
ncbi:hypothetical protein [Bradyrhizobium sp. Gha]|uniref:hypothetical protein n=1 Tax=Bradyrhizobium sp. Gha TaxID=1855318 RepID=UPI0008E380CA|nr:hypothetical protein [Bradyrhizobium sp. Gha]SFK28797.1 hypothetical protein SAMN05216525_1795 [Bradyrhizobium sp. Gha]